MILRYELRGKFGDEVIFIYLGAPFLLADWLSLAKAKIIIDLIPNYKINRVWTIVFVVLDVLITYLLVSLCWAILQIMAAYITHLYAYKSVFDVISNTPQIVMWVILDYFREPFTFEYEPTYIFTVSTMLTSVWVMLFLLSSIIIGLLVPIEYLRRFTLWWFKDLDAHPLRAIAKVAATLIVIGAFALPVVRLIEAFALTVVHWGWLMV